MQQFVVRVETVSPLFSGGADPRGVPEIRPPAIRGALRYWLRALLGGLYGDDGPGLKKISAAESLVFGASADDETGQASGVTVRLVGQPLLTRHSYSQLVDEHRTPGPQPRTIIGKPGLAYLLFAARGTRQEPERTALSGAFGLKLQTRPGHDDELRALRLAYGALWLLTHFGGVGARSRRGAGGLQVAAEPQGDLDSLSALPPLAVRAASPEALAAELGQGLNALKQAVAAPKTTSDVAAPTVRAPSRFDVLVPQACKIGVLSRTFNTWDEALNEVGRVYQGFRSRRNPDYGTVKDAIVDRADLAQPVQRAAFGLPVPFFYRSLQNLSATLEADHYDRRASPLWMRVVRLANGKHAVIMVWFRSEFLPSHERLKLRQRQETYHGDLPSDRLIEVFLTGNDPQSGSALKDKNMQFLEVKYA